MWARGHPVAGFLREFTVRYDSVRQGKLCKACSDPHEEKPSACLIDGEETTTTDESSTNADGHSIEETFDDGLDILEHI